MIEYRGASSLTPGTVIASRYEVVKCLGTGSMGMVYACRKRGAPESAMVAVKVLFPDVAHGDKVQAARFRKEIFAAYGVDHPNVVKAWEYIRDGDIVAYSMELITGGDLATKLGRNSTLFSIPQCVQLLSQMCAGVQAIHDAGIVHRDLKPENILLTEDGEVKIVDFGIARLDGGTLRNLTEIGGVIGTIDYVAPEYLISSQIDARADIYAVGVLGYEMITGESPFRGDTIYDTLYKRVQFSAPPPSGRRPECPAALDAVIKRALAIKPENRFQTAQDMLNQLQALPQSILETGKILEEDGEENTGISEIELFGERQPISDYQYGFKRPKMDHESNFQALQTKSSHKTEKKKYPSEMANEDPLGAEIGKDDPLHTNSPSVKIHQHSELNISDGQTPHASPLLQSEPHTTRPRSNIFSSRSDLLLLIVTTIIVIGLSLVLEVFEFFPVPH